MDMFLLGTSTLLKFEPNVEVVVMFSQKITRCVQLLPGLI